MGSASRQETTRYDSQAPRQAQRKGRERGVWVFVPAAELRKAGVDPAGPAPKFRVWGRPRGTALIRFYGRGKES